jgi:hypothetical protein
MGIFFLTEEPSIAPVIERFAADLLDLTNGDWFDVKIHQGKEDLRKVLLRNARAIAPHMLQSYNRSTSFAHFIRGIQVLSDR